MKALRPTMVKRLRTMLNERGIAHYTMDNTEGEIAAIACYIPDDEAWPIEHIIDAESLICEQNWMDLPVVTTDSPV